MKKIMPIILILALAVSLVGCGSTQTAKAYQVSDSRGVQVSFAVIPQKIVSLTPSDTEILYALGKGDSLIAVSEYCNYPDDTKNKQKLPTGEKLNVETLISLKPDAVFMGKMDAMEDQIKQLETAGIKVVVTEANTLEQTYNVINMVGQATGKSKEAADLVSGMKKSFDDIKKEAESLAQKSVYVEVSPLQYGLWSCGKSTFVQELLDMMGAKNIFDDTQGWSAVSEEQVIDRNPDIIFTTASATTGINDPVGDITGRANWNGINAVKNNQVYMLDADMLSRPGPRLVDAARQILDVIKKSK